MNEDEKKKKVMDLTGGTYQPSEQFKQLPDGTMVRLEDPTVAKPQVDPLEALKEEHEKTQNEDESE